MSLRDYIKTKFIENSFLKEFKGVTTPVTRMFIDVGETFGFGNPKKKYDYSGYSYGYETICGLYFYNVNTNNGLKKMAYLDYKMDGNDNFGKSIYCDINGKLYYYNHNNSKITPADINDLTSTDKKEKYLAYVKYISEEKEKKNDSEDITYFFIGNEGDKNFYHGSDEKIYFDIQNGSKTALEENTEDFLKYMGVWQSLQKLA